MRESRRSSVAEGAVPADPGRRAVLAGLGSCAALASLPVAAATAASAWPRRGIDLQLVFRTMRDGQRIERGRETASFDFNDDGTITYRASSSSDTPRVTRDVVYTLDRAFHPLEAFVRLQVDGRHEGSGWFRFEEGRAMGETWNAKLGRAQQSIAIEGRMRAFLTHPVSSDATLCAAFDHSLPDRRQRPPNIYDSSPDPFGRTGPALAPRPVDIEFAGSTRLTTAVGKFTVDHYRLYLQPSDREPLQELWLLQGTYVLVQARAGGVYNTDYELTGWRER